MTPIKKDLTCWLLVTQMYVYDVIVPTKRNDFNEPYDKAILF